MSFRGEVTMLFTAMPPLASELRSSVCCFGRWKSLLAEVCSNKADAAAFDMEFFDLCLVDKGTGGSFFCVMNALSAEGYAP